MVLDQMQVKFNLKKSLNALVVFTSVSSHYTCHFYVSDDAVYDGVINNCRVPNGQHAKSIDQST